MNAYSVFDTLLDSVVVIDEKKSVVYFNDSLETLLEMPRRKIKLATPLYEYLTISDTSVFFMPDGDKGKNDPSPYVEVDYKTQLNKTGKVQVTVQPSDTDGHWIVYLRDVSLEQTLHSKYHSELEKNAMVNSLNQGFLVFGKSGICSSVYTKACETTLECIPADRPVWDVLKINENELNAFKAWVNALILESMPFHDLADLGPKHYLHSKGKKIDLEYMPLRNPDNSIRGVILIATDRTAEYEAQELARKEQEHATQVLRLARFKNQYFKFLKDAERMNKEMRQTLKGDRLSPENLEVILRHLHTMKGASATFGNSEAVDLLHQCEERLKKTSDLETVRTEVNVTLDHLFEIYRKFHQGYESLLGATFGDWDERIDVSSEKLKNFYASLSATKDPVALKNIFADTFLKKPISHLLGHMMDRAESLASVSNKKVKCVLDEGGDIRLFADAYEDLLQSLIHIFTNAVDHGIETVDERKIYQKPESGTIQVRVSREARSDRTWLRFEFEDDGRGIDAGVIRKKFKERGIDLTAEPDERVIQKIFEPGFSTQAEVTNTSGRGIGLDAVKAASEKLGGQVHVRTARNKGTRFIVEIPESESGQ